MPVSFVSGVDEGGRRPSIDGFHCELARASITWAEFVPENGGGAGVIPRGDAARMTPKRQGGHSRRSDPARPAADAARRMDPRQNRQAIQV